MICEREIADRFAKTKTALDHLKAQWGVSQWEGEAVVLEAFGEGAGEKYLTTVCSPEEAEARISNGQLAGINSYYLHHNAVDEAKAQKWMGKWWKQNGAQGVSVYDSDITSIRSVSIDIDPVRSTHKKDNASAAERNVAKRVAMLVYRDLADILGSTDALSLLSSGNGWWIHVSVDHIPVAHQPLVHRVLRACKAIYGTPEVVMDTTSADLRRISPLVGTFKRKWTQSGDRIHRAVGIAAPGQVRPISLDDLETLVYVLETRIPHDAKVEEMPRVYDPGCISGDDTFAACNAVRMSTVVMHWDDPANPTCPVCGAKGSRTNSSVRVLDTEKWNIFSCKHETCQQFKGGPVRYVCYRLTGKRRIEKGDRDTAMQVLTWFRDNCGVLVEIHEDIEIATDEESGMYLNPDEYVDVVAAVEGQLARMRAIQIAKTVRADVLARMREHMKKGGA